MKFFKYISMAALAASSLAITSCSDDELGDTIFPDVSEEVDPSSYSYKFDKWLKENFLDVYNLDFRYKMQDVGTNMNYNLVPADLQKAEDLALLTKYLWYDIYHDVVSPEFLKANGPRIIHVIGSPAINPQSGTMIVGLAEGGIKVTLYRVNALDVNDPDELNELYFHTMHHEFTHILHQNKSYPNEFTALGNGHFDSSNWQDRNPGVVASLGFFTPYGSSESREDFAECCACYITYTQEELDKIYALAACGWKASDPDSPSPEYGRYFYYASNVANQNMYQLILESQEYLITTDSEPLSNSYGSRIMQGQDVYEFGTGTITKREDGKFYDQAGNETDEEGYRLDNKGSKILVYQMGTAPFKLVDPEDENSGYTDANGKSVDAQGHLLDSKGKKMKERVRVLDVEDEDKVDGVATLIQKLDICRKYFKESWGADLDKIREEVQRRQKSVDIVELRKQIENMK